MQYTETHLKECIDHYKCTRLKDHQMGKHSLQMWWCELCVVDLELNASEKVQVEENLSNHKPWFNGIKTFSSVKVNPHDKNTDK